MGSVLLPLTVANVLGVPGKTEQEAVQNYREPILHAVQCLSTTAFLIPGRHSYNYSVGAAGYWRLGDENGLRLKPASGDVHEMVFHAEQAYRIVECEPDKHETELGKFRVTTTMYAYELTIDGQMQWRMHWHPDGLSEEGRPHFHLPGRDHLPSPRHTIEDAIEWCVEYGAIPAVADWRDRLITSKTVHQLHRSWSEAPSETRG